MNRFAIALTAFLLSVWSLLGQEKRDYNWIIGRDPVMNDSVGAIILLDFNKSPRHISMIRSIPNIWMQGSNTSMSDKEGKLLFYSDGCRIINAKGKVMLNGDSINSEYMQRYDCLTSSSPFRQGVIALPAPGSDSLYYVFVVDLDLLFDDPEAGYFVISPQRLFYHVIDMSRESGYGAVILKHQIAVQDTLARGNISAARHANGRDWWVIVPKQRSNCYFAVLVTPEGVQPPQLKCSGPAWGNKESAQAAFSPDQKKYARFDAWNGLNIYDFDNATGDLFHRTRIMFPDDVINYTSGLSLSANSRFAYVNARSRIYQFDLQAPDIEASKVKVAEWDGTYEPNPTRFYLSALAPDGKIYISSFAFTLSLHVIERPNCPGLACRVVQRGVSLPAYNSGSIPNFPHYRISNEECDSTSNTIETELSGRALALYPNPTSGELWVNFPDMGERGAEVMLFDALGRLVYRQRIAEPLSRIDLSALRAGTYVYVVRQSEGVIGGRIAKVE